MQITQINSCKPKRHLAFLANERGDGSRERMRYKHLEMLCDEVLFSNSAIQAKRDVENSGKMRLYKALPAITTGIIGTTIAITQPGKLSQKAARGLGFLAFAGAMDFASNKFRKNSPEASNSANFWASLGAVAAAVAGGRLALKGLGNIKALDGVKQFFQKEINQLAGEINGTKFAKFSNEKIQPLLDKHPTGRLAALFGTAAAASALGAAGSIKLEESLEDDVVFKTAENFKDAKKVQNWAREQFETIEAIEV